MKRGIILIFFLIVPLAYAFCGDGFIDINGRENCLTCPQDNPCLADEVCTKNTCTTTFIPPFFLQKDPSATILIPQEIANQLNGYYTKDYELVACLNGKYNHGIYQITDLVIPKIVETSQFHIKHIGCSKYTTIATIHSHPGGDCKLSDLDIYTFGSRKDPLTAIICGKNNFAFYSNKDFDLRMNYLIRDITEKPHTSFFIVTGGIITLFVIILFLFSILIKSLSKQKKRRRALHIMNQFSEEEKQVVNLFVEIGTTRLKNLPKPIEDKLIRYNIVKIKGKTVSLKRWFRHALKGL